MPPQAVVCITCGQGIAVTTEGTCEVCGRTDSINFSVAITAVITEIAQVPLPVQ